MWISRIDERSVVRFSLMLAVLISLTIPIVNCGDDNPTTPMLDLQLSAGGAVFNSENQFSIRRYQVLLDTVVVLDVTKQSPAWGVDFTVTSRAVARGAHTLEWRIISQTYSPATYESFQVFLNIVYPGPWTPGPQIPDKKQQLATGQGLVWNFSL